MQTSSVRLFAILARRSPYAVVFRRGPSKSVLLVRWNTADDTFQCGQWLKGRIYERRCDLSPEGDLLVYFAASYRKPYFSWTAISRPPYLTALAMWPKGDCWGGGGRFLSQSRLELNHRENELELAEGFSIPRRLKVKQFGKHSGWGEDDPIFFERLKRDGWQLVSYPTQTKDDYGAKVWMEFSPPIKWRKMHPKWPKRYSLDMSILGIREKDGPWYLIEHSLRRGKDQTDNIGRSDWADWSQSGDLLFATDRCLYRVPCKAGCLAPLEDAIKIADFSDCRFEPLEAPSEFRRW